MGVYKTFDRARMNVSTTGTVTTITLTTAVASLQKGYYQTFSDAGMVDGDNIRYTIEDGSDWEIGVGHYIASGTQFSRDTVSESSNSDARINLSGNAQIFNSLSAHDFPGTALVKQDALTTGSLTQTLSNEPLSADACLVSIDGGPILKTDSFSVSGRTLTLSEAPVTSGIVTYIIGNPLAATADIVRGVFAAATGTSSLTMSTTPPSNNSLLVWFGTELQPNDTSVYTWSGNQLTPVIDPEGQDITYLIVQGLAIGTPGDGTVTDAKLSSTGSVLQAILTKILQITMQAGDLIYATGAGAVARLAKGAAGQALVMNAGATAPQWGSTGHVEAADTLTGTSVVHTGIPSWATEVIVDIDQGSFATTAALPMLRLGVASGILSTGYLSAGGDYVPTANHVLKTNGVPVGGSASSFPVGNNFQARWVCRLIDAVNNVWSVAAQAADITGTANTMTGMGRISLGSGNPLTQVSIGSDAGTSSWDNGNGIVSWR